MSYSTNTLTGPATQDLFDALVTFMTGNGWTVIDTIAADDKVLSSTGTSGKLRLYIRLMVNSAAASPFTWLGNPHRAISNILVIGYSYWDVGAHTGKDEYSTWGPWVEITSASNDLSRCGKFQKDGSATPLVASKSSQTNTWTNVSGGNYGNPASNVLFHTKYKTIWSGSGSLDTNGVIKARDWRNAQLPRNNGDWDFGIQSPSDNRQQSNHPAWVYNKATNTEHFYGLADTSPVGATWVRYDVATNTHTTLASPLWATTNPSGGAAVWDGNDTIYVLAGEGTTGFAKYVISTNSWTSLTSAPVARTTWGPVPQMIYLPISAQPGGATQDIIVTALSTGTTTIYKYNVTDNTWSGTYTLPQSIDVTSDYLWWNGRDRILFSNGGNIYRSIPTTNPGTFINLGDFFGGGSNPRACEIFDHHVSLIRGTVEPLLSLKYWFLGDADGVGVVTSIAGNYHWCYFGSVESFNTKHDDIQELQAPVTAGTAQTFTVTSTSSLFEGDFITIWEHTTGTTERVQITDIPNGTQFVATCGFNHNVGASVGIDPAPMVVTGDTYSAVCPISAMGYRVGYDADGYYLRPAFNMSTDARDISNLGPFNISANSTRGSVTVHPFVLTDPVAYGQFSNHPTLTREPKGTIPKVFCVKQPTGAVSEDTLKVRGKTFVIFAPYEYKTSTTSRPYFIALGPID